MTINEQISFDDVLSLVRTLDNSSVRPDGTTTQFLEITKDTNGEGVSINGNFGGLVHFARLVLEVAKKGYLGAHQHFDESSETDLCETSVTVCFKPADWDIT